MPCDTGVCTGPCGIQYKDNDGHTNNDGGRPDERHGYQGSWTHGVTILCGGVPHDVRPSKEVDNHGIVLFESHKVKPDLTELPLIKPGTADERQGKFALFPHRVSPTQNKFDEVELNHGTVLGTFPNLRADMSYEGKTNVIGGRPSERLGTRGGFTHGVRIFRGGLPRDILPPKEVNPGIVLYTSSILKADMSHELKIKPGTSEERQGRCGSFEHGDLHLRMPTYEDAQLWIEAGQKKGGRRYAPGHFLAGTSILAGTIPSYGV
jgi:hypothetical protein